MDDLLRESKFWWRHHPSTGKRRRNSWKKAGFKLEFFLVAKSASDSLYSSISDASAFKSTSVFERKMLHKLSIDSKSEEWAFLACVWMLLATRRTWSGASSVGNSLALEKRERRMPFALSDNCRSSWLELPKRSMRGIINRRTWGLEGCFLRNISTRSRTRFLKCVASRWASTPRSGNQARKGDTDTDLTYLSLPSFHWCVNGTLAPVVHQLPSFDHRP